MSAFNSSAFLFIVAVVLFYILSATVVIVVDAAWAPEDHDMHFPPFPSQTHAVSLRFDTRDGAYILNNAHFGNETTIYIEVDVEHAKIHIENSSFGSLVVHNYLPEEAEDWVSDLPYAIKYFLHHEIKHEQPRIESPTRGTVGNKLSFKVYNCSVEYGIKFTGHAPYTGGNFTILKYNGGPVVYPRIRVEELGYSPMVSIINSTITYKTLPAIRKARGPSRYQISQWVHAHSIRIHHMHKSTSCKFNTETINMLRSPTLIVSGNKIFGGIFWLIEDEDRDANFERVEIKHNMFLDGATINCRRDFNVTVGVGRVDFIGNRFYGTVAPSHTSYGASILIQYAPVFLAANNFADWRFPLAGMQNGANHGVEMQVAFHFLTGITKKVEVKNNTIIVRKAERYFEAGLWVDGGIDVEIWNNEIFVNRTRKHIYSLSNWRHTLAHPQVNALLIKETREAQNALRVLQFPDRSISVMANAVHVRNHHRPMPPKSEWATPNQHEKLDDTRPHDEIKKEREQRRERMLTYENKVDDKSSIDGHDGYMDWLRAVYHDPNHDQEEGSALVRAIKVDIWTNARITIENNTFHINSTSRLHDYELASIQSHDIEERTWIDIINNRFLLNVIGAGSAFHLYTLTNATHTIVRENEFNCKSAGGYCVTLTAMPDSRINNTLNPNWIYGIPDIPDDRTGFRGVTFRRNKIRYMTHFQHTHQGEGAVALDVGGGLLTEDTSIFIQDNDIRGRGLWALIKSNMPRTIIENNYLKTVGHLGGGFYDLHHLKYLYLHHDQLERAPMDLPDWHEKTMIFLDLLEKWHHGSQHPHYRDHPKAKRDMALVKDIHERELKPWFHAVMEAQKSHAKSVYLEHVEKVHEEEDHDNIDNRQEGQPTPTKTVTKVHHKFSVSKSKVEWEPPKEDEEENGNGRKKRNPFASYSKSEIERAAKEAERIDNLPPSHAKELILSPVFATNLTFTVHHTLTLHREFSIQCIIINGKPLEYEEVKSLIPYENMDHWELSLPHNKGIRPSNDVVDFGCPEARGMHVPKIPGAAHEDL